MLFPVSRFRDARAHRDSRSTIYDCGPVHQLQCDIGTSAGGEAENRRHHKNERASHHAYRLAELPQVPWATTEAITNEECLDEDWNCEGNVRSNCPNGEYSTNSNWATEYQTEQANTHASVEPDGIYWSVCVLVDSPNPERHWETSVTGIRKSDSRCSNHATLSHTKAAADSNGQNSKCSLLRQDLNKV